MAWSAGQLLTPCNQRALAWSTQQVVNLLGLWGEEAVQAQLWSICRNIDVYGQITWGLGEKGYNRDMQQCHVKIKVLRQVYQKAREANCHSSVELHTCCFHKELQAFLGGDTTTKSPVDTLGELESEAPTVHKKEEEQFWKTGNWGNPVAQ
ncbi:hypothetical protein G0U57_007556 [Chelydra serpentina]|uniref:Myb/SANT-like DNA-binding domain-containing protein n=1 Tax=Chelydra serpentina TaxID=8475 RepID=A0A8T1SJ62_CHESE|nr:hypothetical protein G0U57_007556 [Chelydra serpentina]